MGLKKHLLSALVIVVASVISTTAQDSTQGGTAGAEAGEDAVQLTRTGLRHIKSGQSAKAVESLK